MINEDDANETIVEGENQPTHVENLMHCIFILFYFFNIFFLSLLSREPDMDTDPYFELIFTFT